MGLGQPPLRCLAQLGWGERFHAVEADLVMGVAQAESVQLGQALGPLGCRLRRMGHLSAVFGAGQLQLVRCEILSDNSRQLSSNNVRASSARSALLEACRTNGAAPARAGR